MDQEMDSFYRPVCSTCLSSDRNLVAINEGTEVYQMLRLLMYDFAGEGFTTALSETQQLLCFECLALLKKFSSFRKQAQTAQDHLRILSMSGQETLDHSYITQSLTSLVAVTRTDYDKIFFNYSSSNQEWLNTYTLMDNQDTSNIKDETYEVMTQGVRDAVNLEGVFDGQILNVPSMELDGSVANILPMGSTLLVPASNNTYTISTNEMSAPEPALEVISKVSENTVETLIVKSNKAKNEKKPLYITEYMSEEDLQNFREESKLKLQYASSVFKCELCIIGFLTQQQVEDHFLDFHRARPGKVACRICYIYIEENKLHSHIDKHYMKYVCSICGNVEHNNNVMAHHVKTHLLGKPEPGSVPIGETKSKKSKKQTATKPKPGDLRKLLSKTVIEGYQCLECDLFFKTSRARKNHVMKAHREGFQCDHCQKRFVNKTTLATHTRLHEGPLPREECPICHKMVRVIQLKYHIRRHNNTEKYTCEQCNKDFSHLATYQAHLKYSRAHASETVYKFPCPMCNRGYPTKEQMQDHFNYQHLGKTSHKCPICEKPIASRANVEKHMNRVHGKRKEKPRTHVCNICSKAFTDKKSLVQHEAIHSGDRPLSCDVCHQTFKQKASLYTHRKRVHKIVPQKKNIEFLDIKTET